MVIVDSFSKFVRVEGMMHKDEEDIQRAFAKVFAKSGKPHVLLFDQESGVMSSKQWLADQDVELVDRQGKAPTAEAMIRTLKRKWEKIKVLNDGKAPDMQVVASLVNDDIAGATGEKPNDVDDEHPGHTEAKQQIARMRLQLQREKKIEAARDYYRRNPLYPVGTRVNVAIVPKIYLKDHQNQYGEEVYTVDGHSGSKMLINGKYYYKWAVRRAHEPSESESDDYDYGGGNDDDDDDDVRRGRRQYKNDHADRIQALMAENPRATRAEPGGHHVPLPGPREPVEAVQRGRGRPRVYDDLPPGSRDAREMDAEKRGNARLRWTRRTRGLRRRGSAGVAALRRGRPRCLRNRGGQTGGPGRSESGRPRAVRGRTGSRRGPSPPRLRTSVPAGGGSR